MASLNVDSIQKLYVAYFNRPADPQGANYWAPQLDAVTGGAVATNAQLTAFAVKNFSPSLEYTNTYAGQTNAQIIDNLYLNLFGRHVESSAVQLDWAGKLDDKTYTFAQIAVQLTYSAQGTDATIVANKIAAADLFTAAIDTVAEVNGYTGAAANQSARTWLSSVTSTAPTPASVTSAVTSAVAAGTSAGTSYVLTTGVDTLVGTAGNDIFIADNTGTTATSSAADSIDGLGGTNVLKIYTKAGSANVLPTLANIQSVYLNGGNGTADTTDISGKSSITSLTVDAQITASGTYTVAAGQAITLENAAIAGNVISATATTLGVTLSAITAGTLDFADALLTSATVTSTGASNTVTLTNTGTASLATLNIAGDQKLTLTESLAGLKTINASTSTGGVIVDASGAASIAAFAFTGGSGNDTIKLTGTQFGALTAGSQLAGGTGTDTLSLISLDNAGAAGAVLSNDYTALSAATGFEVLSLGAAAGKTVTLDFSQLTGDLATAKHILIANNNLVTDTYVLQKLAESSTVDVTDGVGANAITSLTVGGGTGVHTENINLNTSALATGFTTTTLVVSGLSTVNLASNGSAVTVNTIGTLTQGDNTTINITGANGLTISGVTGATATGSTYDAHAFTGALTLGGTTGKGDVILAGSGTTSITELAAEIVGNTITLLAGHTKVDTINVSTAGGTTMGGLSTALDVVSNFNTSATAYDVLNLTSTTAGTLTSAGLGAGWTLNTTTGVATYSGSATITTFETAVLAAAGAGLAGAVEWSDGTNTYVADVYGTPKAQIVELVGVTGAVLGTTAAAHTIVLS